MRTYSFIIMSETPISDSDGFEPKYNLKSASLSIGVKFEAINQEEAEKIAQKIKGEMLKSKKIEELSISRGRITEYLLPLY